MEATRREFLADALATGICGTFKPCSVAAKDASSRRQMSLGFSSYGMKRFTPGKAIWTCHEIGYDGVELTVWPGWPGDPKTLSKGDRRELKDLLDGTGTALESLMENLRLAIDDNTHRANLDRLKSAAELGHALSPDKPPVIETIVGGKSREWQQVKRQMADRLASWAKVAAETQTVIAVKPHVGGALHTPEGARWLLAQVKSPWIRAVYDYSHYALIGLDLAKTIDTIADRCVMVHVKDAKRVNGKPRFLLPGDGDVDYVRYLRLLVGAGFSGPVIVEVSGQIHGRPDYDPVAAAKRCYAHLDRAFRQAGIKRHRR